MKSKLLFVILFPLCLSCNAPAKHPVNANNSSSKVKPDSVINEEYFDWSKAEINGTIPMISSFKEVVKQLGEPDKIDTLADGDNGSYFNRKFQYCSFKSLTFEKYNDTLVFNSINFSKRTNFYLTDGKHRFDRSFKDIDFKRSFPNSFDNNQMSGTSMDIYEYISLHTSQKKTNDGWNFTFHPNGGKIWMIDYDNARTNDELK